MINWLLFVNLWQDRVSLLVLRDRRHSDNHMVARKQAQKRERGTREDQHSSLGNTLIT